MKKLHRMTNPFFVQFIAADKTVQITHLVLWKEKEEAACRKHAKTLKKKYGWKKMRFFNLNEQG